MPPTVTAILDRVRHYSPGLANRPRYRDFLCSLPPARLARIHDSTMAALRPPPPVPRRGPSRPPIDPQNALNALANIERLPRLPIPEILRVHAIHRSTFRLWCMRHGLWPRLLAARGRRDDPRSSRFAA